MHTIIASLEQAIPLIIIVALALFMTVESWIPYFERSEFRKKQRWHNIGNLMVSFALNAALSGAVSWALTTSTVHRFGALYHVPLPSAVLVVIGVLLCDLNSYVAHRLYHRVPLFWRFHRVHHSDVELDATSALRMHPFEFAFQAFTQATLLPLMGVSNLAFVLYVSLSLPLFILNHANIRYPAWYEHWAPLLLVTPNWHRVHHSNDQPSTDSNFADVFTIWDRLFGTRKSDAPENIRFGLENMRDAKSQSFLGLLKAPFVPLK